jgi:hypothetical protein
MAVRNTLSLPVRCSCPTKSSSVCGRIRSANGAEEFIVQIKEENVMEGWNNFYELSVHCYYHHLLCHSLLRSVILVSIVEVSLLIFKNFSMPGNLNQRNTEARSFTERGFHPPCSSVSLRRCGLKKHFSVLNL